MQKVISSGIKFKQALVKRTSTKYIVIHHAEAYTASVQDINQWHLANGWAGIGYNYYVRKDGSIYEGRPEWAVGSHCKGSNDVSIGICCEGNFDDSNPKIKCDKVMSKVQYDSLIALIKDIKSRYKNKLEIKGHKDLYPTACPGKYFPLEKIKGTFKS